MPKENQLKQQLNEQYMRVGALEFQVCNLKHFAWKLYIKVNNVQIEKADIAFKQFLSEINHALDDVYTPPPDQSHSKE